MKKISNPSIPLPALNKLIEFIKGLSASELQELSNGQKTINIDLKESGSIHSKRARSPLPMVSPEELKRIKHRLASATSRQEGKDILATKYKSRSQLEALARGLDIPVERRDTVEHLANKIIEATLGFRLRSNAIRGKNSPQER